ncbi:MAG: hypothetical protein ACI9E1_001844, partial [Cryomorphaceae bacterium]
MLSSSLCTFLAVLFAVTTGLGMNTQAKEPAAEEAPQAVDTIAKPKLKPNIIFVVAD